MAKAKSATIIIGNNDSATAFKQLCYADKVTYISTAGGANIYHLKGVIF